MPQGKEGEISVRGENVTKGYLNNEKANRESFTREGWFRTGDQGKLDEDGYVIITGRIKELINRGYINPFTAHVIISPSLISFPRSLMQSSFSFRQIRFLPFRPYLPESFHVQ